MTRNRVCGNLECKNNLSSCQKRFCSHECRNKAQKPSTHTGRKSLYRQHFAEQDVYEYLKECELNTTQKLVRKKKVVTVPQPIMPSFSGYLHFLFKKYNIRIHKNTLRNWTKKHPEFRDCMEIIRCFQEKYLIDRGATGECNPTIAVFLLKANHGYGRKKPKNVTGLNIVKHVYTLADQMTEPS
ncbi:hypothetical protein CL638_00755 [bacterium]|nr:hypothetical protein [bacterium]